jgi:hypothetical protein
MDVASIKQLLRNLISLESGGLIDPGKERLETWKRIIRDLPAYGIGADGAFKEWLWPGIENYNRHRHCSHMYPLYYEMDPEIDSSASLRAACTEAIEDRLEFRREIKGGTMAYGLNLLGFAAAHLGNSDQAYECLDMLTGMYWSKSLASLHNANSNLNMDISGGYPALVIEMLMYSQKDILEFLPALPEAWPSGEITGLRARGGYEVDIYWKEGRLEMARITSLLGNPVTLKYGDLVHYLDITAGQTYTFSP